LANCTTPAQYFHVLRRQMYGGPDRRGVRKPLVVFTPKSLLRHPKVVSELSEFSAGSFREVLEVTDSVQHHDVSRVLVCSGKIYYELLTERSERGADHVAIVRLEQLYPFPEAELHDTLLRYPATAPVIWVQEEPHNMGAWRFVKEHISPLLEGSGRLLRYIGRPDSASPAAGSYRRHQHEQMEIIEEAFAGSTLAPSGPIARKRTRLVPRRNSED